MQWARPFRLDDRREWFYDNLILATGAVPRQLEATQDLDRVFVLRDPTHARQLRAAMATSRTAIVIGGGYIGLEAAASMAKAGITVHVIEVAPRLLARVASPQISDFFASLQKSYGVYIHTSQKQIKIMSKAGGFTGVDFGDGTVIAGDLLLVGIGVVPDTGLAVAAGTDVDNGIVVDARMRTSVPYIYAIGDAARRNDRAVRSSQWITPNLGRLLSPRRFAVSIHRRLPPRGFGQNNLMCACNRQDLCRHHRHQAAILSALESGTGVLGLEL